ncbi:hypothetical protein VPNG_02892 [Cytospora leucostoma]|uniref:Xylanolytic transcriptional activator regulatory domain-containing protein n=1 Tax=Cytospora leucostoma TaxID=1230097 RepID=A0A423XJ92_9PEZI|nr:hypothetical protein VPNG_02892 [Cytospora leucostoma]
MALAVDNTAEPAEISMSDGMEGPALIPDVLGPHGSLTVPIPEDLADFDPMHNLFQDMDFSMSWDMDFDAFAIPELELQGPSTGSSMGTSTATTTRKRSRSTMRDPSHGHCAFKRSPWLWEPQEGDYVQQQKEALHVDEQSISKSPAFGRNLEKPTHKLEMSVHQRDRIFSIVLAQNKDPLKVPSFPSLNLLNYLLQAHFIQDEYQFDSWIHAASFDPNNTLPELLASVISSGAGFISIPAIWQFGLAMHEVVRLGINDLFEKSNTNTRDLKALQAFMLQLEVGMWSGFKRQMEIAESFIQPLLTNRLTVILQKSSRQSGRTSSHGSLTKGTLIIHLFTFDVQSSVSLQKNPLISFSELSFSLPASRDLWRAKTPEAWRQAHNSKTAMPRSLPLMSETIHCVDMLDELEEFIDIELCYSAILHGYWGQIWGHREAVRFYAPSKNGGAHRLWLKTQHQELYSDLCAFSTLIYTSTHPLPHSTHLTIVLELFLMILHVSPDELQRFAGKCGEEEARRAAISLEENWANTSESRQAIWHAGQVIAKARRMPPTSLRGFNATTVYLASLTLWTYGLFCSSLADGREGLDPYLSQPGGQQPQPHQASASRRALPPPSRGSSSRIVLLDGEETRETKAFLQLGRGVPGLSASGGSVQPLSDPGRILPIARSVLRENYPVRSEPLPPLVQSLENLMRDLGSGAAGHASRLPSGVQSRAASRMGSEERA